MLTSEQVQQYIRVVIYWAAGFAVNYGWISNSDKAFYIGMAVSGLNLAWTVYGTRLVAKLNELAKYKVVQAVVVTDADLAKATPSPKIDLPK